MRFWSLIGAEKKWADFFASGGFIHPKAMQLDSFCAHLCVFMVLCQRPRASKLQTTYVLNSTSSRSTLR